MAIYALDGIKPELPPGGSYWVAPTATVIGRVKLLKDASVWWGATVRGDTDLITIGEDRTCRTDRCFTPIRARRWSSACM